MRRSTLGDYVAFSLTKGELARLARLTRQFGYAHLGPMAADVFRIGLDQVDQCFAPTGSLERFLAVRQRVRRKPNGANDHSRRGARSSADAREL